MGARSTVVDDRAKVLFIGEDRDSARRLAEFTGGDVDVAAGPMRAAALLAHRPYVAIHVSASHLAHALHFGHMLESERTLEALPDGVVLLNAENRVQWANRRMREWFGGGELNESNFYDLLESPEILGPELCPFTAALDTGRIADSTIRDGRGRYFQVHAAVLEDETQGADAAARRLIVTVRDVTDQTHQQQKLAAIHQAGLELANLTPDELFSMTVDERIDLLKSNILHYTQDLLNFDVVEIRLLDSDSGRLAPLLALGMDDEATQRDLFARVADNGVTGFVAATGKSYLCEDTSTDPLYMVGVRGAKSSLTVPLVLHDDVIGTFNVESPKPKAFTESDRQFLEIFSRDVANALNTLELLVVEQATAAAQSIEAVHREVALPVDDILNDAVNLMERYIGHEPEVVERLQGILRNARDIKQVIQMVGKRLKPGTARPAADRQEHRPDLDGRRILVADADNAVRVAAHDLLERYGCVVETAHDGAEALCMVRAGRIDFPYDCIIADIRLPDMSGHQFMLRLRDVVGRTPLALMTGYGYDPGHSLVKARQEGLESWAILFKPFRLDQLLDAVERVVSHPVADPRQGAETTGTETTAPKTPSPEPQPSVPPNPNA